MFGAGSGLHVAVALSGGGHRATAWALGVIQALIGAGLGPTITSVTSVSGASVTNAVVANAVDLHTATRNELDDATSDLRSVVATEGLFAPGPHSLRYLWRVLVLAVLLVAVVLALVTAILTAGRDHASGWWLVVGVPVAGLAHRTTRRLRRSRVLIDSAPSVAGWWVLATSLLAAFAAWSGAFLTMRRTGTTSVVVIGCIAALAALLGRLLLGQFSQRGAVCRASLDKAFFHGQQLESLGPTQEPPGVNHIFATADLESGDSVYLAPRFVASYRRGITSSRGVSIASAVQASAALAGAFPPAMVEVSDHFVCPWLSGEPNSDGVIMPLTDGGAYDNMGDQWDLGRAGRLRLWDDYTPEGLGPDPTMLVVANASSPWEWKPWTARGALQREIASVARNLSLQHDQTTATRRRLLFDSFADALADEQGLRGVLLMIDRSPFHVCDSFINAGDAALRGRSRMARNALAAAGECSRAECEHVDARCPVRQAWQVAVAANSAVPTTLGPIGTNVMESILCHARTLCTTYLYVLHDIAAVDRIEGPPTIDALAPRS